MTEFCKLIYLKPYYWAYNFKCKAQWHKLALTAAMVVGLECRLRTRAYWSAGCVHGPTGVQAAYTGLLELVFAHQCIIWFRLINLHIQVLFAYQVLILGYRVIISLLSALIYMLVYQWSRPYVSKTVHFSMFHCAVYGTAFPNGGHVPPLVLSTPHWLREKETNVRIHLFCGSSIYIEAFS
jgi:hypothetical protein